LAQRSRKRGRHAPAAKAAPKSTAPRRSPAPETQPVAAPSRGPTADADPGRGQWFAAPTGEELTRSQRRDAEARAHLTPLARGEHPPVIIISTVVAALLALTNLVAFLAGDKIGGKRPAVGEILVFSAVLLACAVGLWRAWYGAVLGFMALLAIIATAFALLLIEASNVLGFFVALIVVIVAGWLFFKLVRVLSRIQMPRAPSS
jgi:hypothetical protein